MEITGSKAVAEKQEPIEPGAGNEDPEREETRQERQSRERQSAKALLTELRAEVRSEMRAEHQDNIRRRLAAERGELVAV
jgi:hypothetical protein